METEIKISDDGKWPWISDLAEKNIEMSFQLKMKELENKAEMEKQELEEFEMLEKATNDFIPNCSSSVLLKILQKSKDNSVLKPNGLFPIFQASAIKNNDLNEDKKPFLEKETDNHSDGVSSSCFSGIDDNVDLSDSPPFSKVTSSLTKIRKKKVSPSSDEESWSDCTNTSQLKIARFPMEINPSPSDSITKAQNNCKLQSQNMKDSPSVSHASPRLFPNLQHDVASVKKKAMNIEEATNIQFNIQVQSKINELNKEIEKFRRENESLIKLKKERELLIDQLKNEINEFEEKKNKDFLNFQEFKTRELNKIKKEKLIFANFKKNTKQTIVVNDKREMDELNFEVLRLKDEIREKEIRWNTTISRLKLRIDLLEKEKYDLSQELKIAEKRRITSKLNDENVLIKGRELSEIHFFRSQNEVSKPSNNSCQDLELYYMNDYRYLKSSEFFSHIIGKREFNEEDILQKIDHMDGKEEFYLKNHKKIIVFPNGTQKEVSSDGQTVTVFFFNGDVKQIKPGNQIIYYYADTKTIHVTHEDGLEVMHFPGNQMEKHYPNGIKEIKFPDQTIRYLFPDGSEKSVFPDGTVLKLQDNGERLLELPNGQKEMHTNLFKKREYPDGTLKIVYPDGRQETRYSNGRVRVKDKDGHIILDQML